MPREKLSLAVVNERLAQLDGWHLVDGKLHRQFVFTNFIEAFGFMTQVALVAEQVDHHPEWLNVYKTVDVWLITHHTNGISKLDFELADRMNAIALKLMPPSNT